MSDHYLIHLPHFGTKIPKKYLGDYYLSQTELQNSIYQYADLYTDEIFSALYDKFGGVKNCYSRLLFDPERFGDDEMEDMHKKFKLGWFYENDILNKKPLRSTKHRIKLREYFDKHHNELNSKTEKKLNLYGKCTVIDCHSFSNERYWFHDKNLYLPDVCIGFEKNHKDSNLINIILEEFKEYNVELNRPYVGSLIPTNYWGKDFRVKSVMIEINKKLYLNPDNISKSRNFDTIKEIIDNISKKIKV